MAESLITAFLDGLLFVMAIGGAAFIAFLIWKRMQYKHSFRLRELTGTKKLIFDDHAREVTIDGIKKWELLKLRRSVPLPPDNAIDLNSKGKKVVEAYLTQTGDIVYCVDDNDLNTIHTTTGFKPFTTKQKHIYMAELRKSEERKKKKWQDMVVPLASIAALVIIVVALMIFYEDMGKPLLEMGSRQADIAAQQAEMMKTIQEIIQNKQIIGGNEPPPN